MPITAKSAMRTYFGFGKQSAMGTAVAPTGFPRWLDGSRLTPEVRSETLREGTGSREATLLLKRSQIYRGELLCYPRSIEAGFIAAAILGAGSDSVSGGGAPYTHTITPKGSPAYYSAEFGLLDSSLVYRAQDCVFDRLTIECEAGRPVKFTAKYAGGGATSQGSAAAVSNESGSPMLFTGGTFTIDGASLATVSRATLVISNHIDVETQFNGVSPLLLTFGALEVSVMYTLLFQDSAQFKKLFWNSGTSDSHVVGTGSLDLTFLAGGTDTNNSLRLQVPQLSYVAGPVEPALDGRPIFQECRGFGTSGASPAVTVVAKNTQAGAY